MLPGLLYSKACCSSGTVRPLAWVPLTPFALDIWLDGIFWGWVRRFILEMEVNEHTNGRFARGKD